MNSALQAVGVEVEDELPYKVKATNAKGKAVKALNEVERARYDAWKRSHAKEWAAIDQASKICQSFRIQIWCRSPLELARIGMGGSASCARE
jgi:hypothetical protein